MATPQAEMAALRRGEAEEWRRRVVVSDPVMRTTLPQRGARSGQLDRVGGILQVRGVVDHCELEPSKKGL